MNAKTLIEINRRELKAAEEQGLTSVSTATLYEIFDNLDRQIELVDPSAIEIEKFRSDLAGSLAHQEHINSWDLEGFRQVIALGQSTLKSIMLINGGAAVALLAFLGNLMNDKPKGLSIIPFANAMQAFVIGVFLSAAAYALTYLSQLAYDGPAKWQRRTGVGLHVVTALTATAALSAFLWGAQLAYQGFIRFG